MIWLCVARAVGGETRETPHTVEDIGRSFPVSLEELFEACKEACKDVGADHLQPRYELDLDRGTALIAAAGSG